MNDEYEKRWAEGISRNKEPIEKGWMTNAEARKLSEEQKMNEKPSGSRSTIKISGGKSPEIIFEQAPDRLSPSGKITIPIGKSNEQPVKEPSKGPSNKQPSGAKPIKAEIVDEEMEAARKKGYDARMKDKRAREIEAAEKAGAREAMTLKSKIKADVKTAREFVKALKPKAKSANYDMRKEVQTVKKIDKDGNVTITETTHEKPVARAKSKKLTEKLIDAIDTPARIGHELAKHKAAREKAEAAKAKRKSKPKLATRKGTIGRNQGTLVKRENTLVKHEANLGAKSKKAPGVRRETLGVKSKKAPVGNAVKDGPGRKFEALPVRSKKVPTNNANTQTLGHRSGYKPPAKRSVNFAMRKRSRR